MQSKGKMYKKEKEKDLWKWKENLDLFIYFLFFDIQLATNVGQSTSAQLISAEAVKI